MTVVTLPLFGAVVAGNEYDTSVDFGGRPVEASLMLSEVAELEAGSELEVFCTRFSATGVRLSKPHSRRWPSPQPPPNTSSTM